MNPVHNARYLHPYFLGLLIVYINMARTEQKYVIDREALDHLLSMLRDGLAHGASDKEMMEQTFEILDPQFRGKLNQSLKEAKEGRVKRFKDADEMIRDLRSS